MFSSTCSTSTKKHPREIVSISCSRPFPCQYNPSQQQQTQRPIAPCRRHQPQTTTTRASQQATTRNPKQEGLPSTAPGFYPDPAIVRLPVTLLMFACLPINQWPSSHLSHHITSPIPSTRQPHRISSHGHPATRYRSFTGSGSIHQGHRSHMHQAELQPRKFRCLARSPQPASASAASDKSSGVDGKTSIEAQTEQKNTSVRNIRSRPFPSLPPVRARRAKKKMSPAVRSDGFV